MNKNKQHRGFTLIELLVVIGILSILTAATLIAVNPGRQFVLARDTQRQGDLYNITNAIYQYAVDNQGNVPTVITSIPTNIGTAGGLIDLTADLVPIYISSIPRDPTTGTEADTHYTIYKNNQSRIVASAASELKAGTSIIVIR
ncbi:type II secretion system protein [Patescibacteria group bacterium]